MPQIDVTELLLDPYIAGETFTVIRREETVNGNGESVITSQIINAIGSVTPSGDQSLERDAAYEVQKKSIHIVTAFRLRGASKDAGNSWQPDYVLWRGDYFVVIALIDFSKYGAGVVEADCTSVDHVDIPPLQLPPVVGKLDFSKQQNSGLIPVV